MTSHALFRAFTSTVKALDDAVLSSGWPGSGLYHRERIAEMGQEPAGMDTVNRRVATSAGPNAAFEQFFRVQERDLLAFCWALTTDPDEARDVTQEAMARAWQDWDRLADGNPAGWIRTVALNLVRSRHRSATRGEASLNRLATQSHATTEDRLPTSQEVVAALRSLTERQREAVVLHHMADMSVADVAEAMDVSEASVKTHLQRGRAALEPLLADHASEWTGPRSGDRNGGGSHG